MAVPDGASGASGLVTIHPSHGASLSRRISRRDRAYPRRAVPARAGVRARTKIITVIINNDNSARRRVPARADLVHLAEGEGRRHF